ncbi:MAG: prepilin-type N-terminal cleavage/methylation domain-containing protein, partial [Oscillibacter sp.]|nr:prepilin-type N-terminal cleavage/methylation domain-containing protein [Oscillibacter sp.]
MRTKKRGQAQIAFRDAVLKRPDSRGYTLAEMLLVVGLLLILMAVGM